jgi:KDO2-lipid IV(A) lauroyltransferase
MLTELGLYKLLGENPNRTWRFALPWVTPITNAIAPSWGYGHERVPLTGGAVIASNHLSEVDPAMLGIHCRRTMYYMAKIELLSVPIAGEFLRWTGTFAVRRGEGDRDSMRVARWVVREGHAVAFLSDQGVLGLASTYVPFFGMPAKTPRGPAVFALRLKVPILFGITIREPDGRYRIYFEDVPVVETGDRERDTDAIVAAYTRTLEKYVRRAPEQYFWHHRRWRRQPADTPPELRDPTR